MPKVKGKSASGSILIQRRKSRNSKDLLNEKQTLFVNLLLANREYSYADAAREAGYKNPSITGNNLVKQPKIAAALGEALDQRCKRLEMTADRILQELSYLALRDPLDLCDANGKIVLTDMRKLPERIRRCIDGIKVRNTTEMDGTQVQTIEIKLASKLGSLELAAKHFGLLQPDQHTHTHYINWDPILGAPPRHTDVIEARLVEEKGQVTGGI